MTAQRQGLAMPSDGLSATYSFIYDDGYEYMIQRPQGSKFEGDIMIGGGSTVLPEAGFCEFGTTDDTTIEPLVLDYLRNSTARYFGQHWGEDHAHGRIRRAWTGVGYPFRGVFCPHLVGLHEFCDMSRQHLFRRHTSYL